MKRRFIISRKPFTNKHQHHNQQADKQKPASLLLPYLHNTRCKTLWVLDESAYLWVSTIEPSPQRVLITNRFDIYQQAKTLGHAVFFTDFDADEFPSGPYEQVIYRIAKEKAQVHHIFCLASQQLSSDGQLIISGSKQEGIKSYTKTLIDQFESTSMLSKHGNAYIACATTLTPKTTIGEHHYADLQKIPCESLQSPFFFSKPGIFGWKKIDQGTEILLGALEQLSPHLKKGIKVLDLGCGYGWIFLNLDAYAFDSIVATDNNAGAISAALANQKLIDTPCSVVAGDCANTINNTFDLILCNPPFHQGFEHSQELTKKFLLTCANKLTPKGQALIVVNDFIAVEKIAAGFFKNILTLERKQGFTVKLLQK